jgi:hypothetical protein
MTDRRTLQHLEVLAAAGEFSNTLLRFGISDGYSQLKNSEASPESIIGKADSELRLVLHHGSKFFNSEPFVKELIRKRLNAYFLIHEDLQDADIERMLDLEKQLKSRLEIRTYATAPDFRLVFVDQQYLMLSHYTSEEEEREAGTQASWEAPQLRIDARLRPDDNNVNYSLFGTFKKIWAERWKQGRPLDLDRLNTESAIRNHE